jgi:hypothetical protein
VRTTTTIAVAAILATTIGATTPAEAASTCRGLARHMESGSVALPREPVLIVPERRGRCVLILSGWGIQADSEHLFGSAASRVEKIMKALREELRRQRQAHAA